MTHDLHTGNPSELKRRVLIFIFAGLLPILALPGRAFGQTTWTNSGNDLYVSNSGNVGIGTTSPGNKLHVKGGIADVLKVESTSSTATLIFTTASGQNAELTAGTNGMQFNSPIAGKDITFLTQGTNAVVFKSGGNLTMAGSLGVGTSTPATKLHIIGGSNDVMKVESTTNTANIIFTTTAGQSGEFTASLNGMQFNSPLPGKDITFVTQGTNPIVFKSGGNVGIGTASPSTKLHVAGDVTVDGVISASYSDLAEWVQADRPLPDGTVVVIDKRRINGVIASSRPYDLSVAGVVSAMPGVLLGQAGKDKLKVATTGRVKVKVDASNAPIEIGDLLVSSGREGMAMRSDPVEVANIKMHRPGTLIGKALEPLAGGEGEILVLLSLQ